MFFTHKIRQSQGSSLLFLLLFVTFIRGLIMSIIVPMWEFPDEQAHFAQVAYYVEKSTTFDSGNDVSREIYEHQKALGTVRDDFGRNNYTYNAIFTPAYTDSVVGVYEQELNSLSNSHRVEFVKKEAARYPFLFYFLSSFGYRLGYEHNLFVRLFFTRAVSVFIFTTSVYFAYKIGDELFKESLLALAFASVVSFHPMFSFLSSGVNNDNLTNLIGLILVWQCFSILRQGLSVRASIIIGVVSGIGILTKPLVLPAILGVGVIILYEWLTSRRSIFKEIRLLLPLVIGGLGAGGWKIVAPYLEYGQVPYIVTWKEGRGNPDLTFLEYLKPQLIKYYRETFVWYWGVFKWLGVVLPFSVIRVLKVAVIVAVIGLLRLFIQSKEILLKKQMVASILLSFVFVFSLTLWDFDGVRKNGFSHGLQGRYFFPVIGAHVALLVTGITQIFPKYKKLFSLILIILISVLNTYSMFYIASLYYSFTDMHTLFVQMSQYKPVFLKYPSSLVWIISYVVLLGTFVYAALLEYKRESKVKTQKGIL